jgi:hypothetical protein
LRKDLDSEQAKAKKLLTGLPGEKAVAEHKTKTGCRLTVIGSIIGLDKELVAIAETNALRALHGYMTTDLIKKHPVKLLQKLVSWGPRYGKICRHMRPFVRYLYRVYAGRKQYASGILDASGRLVMRLFRTLFMLGLCSRNHYTRVVKFDGSLSGIGIVFLLVDLWGSKFLWPVRQST